MGLKTMAAAAAGAMILTGAVAHAEDFTFTFMGDTVHPGTVTGTIYGLENNATSEPTSVTATGVSPTGTFTDTYATTPGSEFTVQKDEITAAAYFGRANDGAEIGLNHSSTNALAGSYSMGYAYIVNNDGFSGVTYTAVPSVSAAPEPSIWALMMLGVGLLGARLRAAPRRWSPAAVG